MEIPELGRKRLAAAVILVSAAAFILLPNFFTAGFSYILGDSPEVENKVDSSGVNESKHWVQESYSTDHLSPKEYYVTQQNGTELPYKNEYYDHFEKGIYVDAVSGEPLFSSKHKFKSGTGWPHFYRPLERENVVLREEPAAFDNRIEVRSRHADSHLGHVFSDGIAEKTPTGVRYCMNSAALEFIPVEDLEERGYGEYVSHFENGSEN